MEWLESATAVQRKFRDAFGVGRRDLVPSKSSIVRWHSKFIESGTILRNKSVRRRSVRTEDAEKVVIAAFSETPRLSLRRVANLTTMSKTSIARTLKDHGFHPYKLQTAQQLFEEDKHNRMMFAADELERIANDPEHLEYLFFSDEAHFHLNGGVNRHNCRYWSDDNPGWYAESPLHSPRVTVWAAISLRGTIGPFFFEGNVTGQSYLQLLINKIWPSISGLADPDKVRFMQDGAPPHWAREVRNWLNESFEDRWMGRGSPSMPWPPRSPDLTPMDFFLWGYIKSLVYTSEIADLEELKHRIRKAFDQVTVEMQCKAIQAYRNRLQRCLDNEGGHIEITYAT